MKINGNTQQQLLQLEKVSKWILKHLYLLAIWIAEHVLWALLKWIGHGIAKTLENLWQAFVKALAHAFGKIIGYVSALILVFAFALAFSANGYSLSATFSIQGLQTLWETFK